MNTEHVKEQSNSSQGIKKENSSWKSLQPNCNVVIGSKLQFQTKKCAPLNLPGARGGLKLFPWEEPRLGTGAGLCHCCWWPRDGRGVLGRDTHGRAHFRAERSCFNTLCLAPSAVLSPMSYFSTSNTFVV